MEPQSNDVAETVRLAQFILDMSRRIEASLGVSEGFLRRLIQDDDWAMVIKLHALIEAAMLQAIGNATALPALDPVIQRLPFKGKPGKLSLASDLGLLGDEAASFIEALSEMRNVFAHRPANSEMTIDAYLDQRKDGEVQRGKLMRTSTYDLYRQVEASTASRKALWFSGLLTVVAFGRLHAEHEAKSRNNPPHG